MFLVHATSPRLRQSSLELRPFASRRARHFARARSSRNTIATQGGSVPRCPPSCSRARLRRAATSTPAEQEEAKRRRRNRNPPAGGSAPSASQPYHRGERRPRLRRRNVFPTESAHSRASAYRDLSACTQRPRSTSAVERDTLLFPMSSPRRAAKTNGAMRVVTSRNLTEC